MKDLLQKLPLKENTSFVCRTYRTPDFETPWHYHVEYELVLMTEGSGNVLVGDYIGDYEEGDIFFLGSNLPHWFRKKEENTIGSAIVIQFRESVFGDQFWSLPELQSIRQLLTQSARGVQITGTSKSFLSESIRTMEASEGYHYFRLLFDCLHHIAENRKNRSYLTLSGGTIHREAEGAIGKIFEYTFANLQEEIKVEQVATLLNMSVSTFMRFFKKNTKKSYIQFLKEVRIAKACKQLAKSQRPISAICAESGYNNWANFCRQFREIKGMSPSDYRKKMSREPYL
ncbi:AraC family transcriptional regulator [Flavitalea antarctica]